MGILIFIVVIVSCSKDATQDATNNLEKIDKTLVFIIAGQSNAEGNVLLSGLTQLQQAIPEGSEALSEQQRTTAREAIAKSLGIFCEVEPACITNPENCPDVPFSFASADAVIDGLRASEINWRALNATYAHESAQLLAANYYYSPTMVIDADGEEIDNENCAASPSNTSLQGPFLERYTNTRLRKLTAGFGAETENGEISFGPELGFGIQMAESVTRPIVLKVTMGGSSLNDSWRKSGTLYQALIEDSKKAAAENNAEFGGFIWFQGFNDQFEDPYCQPIPQRYENNLRELLDNVRTDLGTPNLPVVIVEARNGGELPVIQAAQNTVVNADANTALVVSKDLSDCFHYCSGSQLLIGERVANSMVTLIQ